MALVLVIICAGLTVFSVALANKVNGLTDSVAEWRREALDFRRKYEHLKAENWKLRQTNKDLDCALDEAKKNARHWQGKAAAISIEAQKRSLESDVKAIKEDEKV